MGITHPAATALTRTGVAMIISQTTENIATTEKETGVTTGTTGTEVMMTTQGTANTQSTEAIGTPTLTENTEVIEIVVDTETKVDTETRVDTETMVRTENIASTGIMGTENMADTESMGSTMWRYNPQVERPLERRTGPTRVGSLWRDHRAHRSRTWGKFDDPSLLYYMN